MHYDAPEDLSVHLVVLAHGAEAEVFAEVAHLLLRHRLVEEGRDLAHHGRQVLYEGQGQVRVMNRRLYTSSQMIAIKAAAVRRIEIFEAR